MDFWLKRRNCPRLSHTLSLPRASLPLSGFRDSHCGRPRFGRPCSRPATKVDGAGTKMTGPPSSSYPSQVSPSAVEISPENRREKLGFARNFAGFVLRRPAAIFGDQVRVRPDFGMRFRPLPFSGDAISLWTPTRCRRVWRRVGTVAEGHFCPIVILSMSRARSQAQCEVARVFGLAGVLTGPAQCEVARVFGLAGVLTGPAQCEVARVFGLAGVLTGPAQCEVARVFGLAGVLTGPVRGREPGLIGKSYVWLDPLVGYVGSLKLLGETLPKCWQKVSCPKSSLVNEDVNLRSKPGVGVMPGSPQGSSRVPGNSGRVLSKRSHQQLQGTFMLVSMASKRSCDPIDPIVAPPLCTQCKRIIQQGSMVGFPFPLGLISSITGYASLSEEFHWLASASIGIILCNIVYRLTRLISLLSFEGYHKLSKAQRVEWNNRGFSTVHAIAVAFSSFYLLLLSDTFHEDHRDELIISRRSTLSDTTLGKNYILLCPRMFVHMG
ncbi:unnamed protein product [Prunus armeniaca]